MAGMTHKEKDAVIADLKQKIEELENSESSGKDITGNCEELLAYAYSAVPAGDPVKERRVKNLIKKAIAKL